MEDQLAAELVALLQEAAQVEQCLLNTYLFAACSLKSHPEEFAELADGRQNRRRAVQFERVRSWKQALLEVAREEMEHLHYVQCLLRALGESPYFVLPERDAGGSWLFAGWRERIGGRGQPQNTAVPVERFGQDAAQRFVLYEATDALQDSDPLGPSATELFEHLRELELDIMLESVLFEVSDDTQREMLKAGLRKLYEQLPPAEPVAPRAHAAAVSAKQPEIGSITFQSIADLYNKEILPRYKEAFRLGRVPHANLDLNEELLDPDFAAEGFLPIGPIHRDKNFDKQASKTAEQPLYHYRDVDEVVSEIVEEGEGLTCFVEGAKTMLETVRQLGGARAYLQALAADASDDASPTPPWLQDAQRIRLSHLYRFAVTLGELKRELKLAGHAGTAFEPARQPLPHGSDPLVDRLAVEAPKQFNVCYLALVAWLERMYEITTWESDRRRRMGIEMLAAWPMMSIAIRPFLELLSFAPIDNSQVFRLESGSLPVTPTAAGELLKLHDGDDRSQEIHERMDELALKALSGVATWAADCRTQLTAAKISALPKRMIDARLSSLAGLDEFERQFPFREHGGYSDRVPDLEYLATHPDRNNYEEGPLPTELKPKEFLFQETLLLRVRFAGRGLVQLATDPDPPTDESGCSGTHMLHAADGAIGFDRALVWQPKTAANAILREPRDRLPPVGIRGVEVALMVTGGDGAAKWGYTPIGVLNSSGAVQTTGLQQTSAITGLNPVVGLGLGDDDGLPGLDVDLLPRDGQMPFLNGNNHLVWRDGEPIDPWILSIRAGAPGSENVELLRRETFSDGRSIMQMDPLQRLYSSRGPSGAGSVSAIPDWALATLSDEQRRLLSSGPEFAGAYLAARADVLHDALTSSLQHPNATREQVDATISFAERLRLVARPRATTIEWLRYVFHYAHTMSGGMSTAASDPVLATLGKRIGAELAVSDAQRGTPNGRWLVRYYKGVMDTDALSDLIYGELYVPLTVRPGSQPVRSERSWRFVAGMNDLVAAYACAFDKPFWAPFQFSDGGMTRTTALPPSMTIVPKGTKITERLVDQSPTQYTYTATGVPGISDYKGSFSVEVTGDATDLVWSTEFRAADGKSLATMLAIVADAAQTMEERLAAHFSPS